MALPLLGLEWESGDSVGVPNALMVSGSRATGGCLDTVQEMEWRSWVEEGCEKKVLLHGRRQKMERMKRLVLWKLEIHWESHLS